MAKKEGIQKKLEKVRPPRVKLSYEVEIGDAIEVKDLPFVVGVLGDFTGKQNPDNPLPKLKERAFVDIHAENFDAVMEGMGPNASFLVKNKVTQDGQFHVDLKFNSMKDFRPESVVEQVPALKELLEARTKLSDLRNKLAGNDKLGDILGDVLANTEQRNQLVREAKGSKE